MIKPQLSRPSKPADRPGLRSGWSHWTVLALVVLCFFLVVRLQPFQWLGAQQPDETAKSLARLQLQPLTGSGQPVTLADLKGRVVLINFWGTWCPACRSELGRIAEIERKFRDQSGFRLLAVSCGANAKEDLGVLDYDTRLFLQQANITMPTYADPKSVTRQAVAAVVGFDKYPTTVLLDRQGVIRGLWSGAKPDDDQEMRQLITQLLRET